MGRALDGWKRKKNRVAHGYVLLVLFLFREEDKVGDSRRKSEEKRSPSFFYHGARSKSNQYGRDYGTRSLCKALDGWRTRRRRGCSRRHIPRGVRLTWSCLHEDGGWLFRWFNQRGWTFVIQFATPHGTSHPPVLLLLLLRRGGRIIASLLRQLRRAVPPFG